MSFTDSWGHADDARRGDVRAVCSGMQAVVPRQPRGAPTFGCCSVDPASPWVTCEHR
jgi:hypothetical protein